MNQLSRPFRAKFASTCSVCGKPIEIGHMIRLNSVSGPKIAYHQDCDKVTGTAKVYVNLPGGTKPSVYKRRFKRK